MNFTPSLSKIIAVLSFVVGLTLCGTTAADAQAQFTVVHSFNGADGSGPFAGVLQGNDGALYGTTAQVGTVFRFDPASHNLTTLHEFTGSPDGFSPSSALIQDGSGTLFGVTEFGGSEDPGDGGDGSLYSLGTTGLNYTVRFNFLSSEASPNGDLILGADGKIYGVTLNLSSSGDGIGSIFRFDPGTNAVSQLFHFSGANGQHPNGPLIRGSDGSLYGTTAQGGASGPGTVFKLDSSNSLTVLHSFTGNEDGGGPQVGLTLGSDGLYYGVTSGGGFTDGSGSGVIFRINAGTQAFETLYTFSVLGGDGTNSDGASPMGHLIQGSDGQFYGTTPQGGPNATGTVFRFNATSSTFTVLHAFDAIDSMTGTNNDGYFALAGLIEASDGFYGTAAGGGSMFNGTIYKISFPPRLQVNGVLSQLQGLAGTIDKKDKNDYNAAVSALAQAVDLSRWTDDGHLVVKKGDQTFQLITQALQKLENLQKKNQSGLSAAQLQSYMNTIVTAMRQVTVTAINEAPAAGVSPKKIAGANQELGKGDQSANQGKESDALGHYKNAWKQVTGG